MPAITIDVFGRDRGGGHVIEETGRRLDNTAGKMDKFRDRAKTVFAVTTAAAVAFGKSSVDAAVEAEQAQTRLSDAFARFPKLADVNIEALRELNAELMKKTKFDDDALASGQAVLAQFDLTGKQVLEMTPLLADYASKTGQEVPDAAEKLGKAFMGNTKALKELGINYKSTGDRAKDVANITGLLREKVGGFAEKEGKTAAGQAAILKNQFGELQEAIGQKLIPILIRLAEFGLKALKWIEDNREAATIILSIVGALWLLNFALAANPVVLIAAGIVALVAALVILWTRSAGFRDFVIDMWHVLKTAFTAYFNVYKAGFEAIIAVFQGFVSAWSAGWQRARALFDAARHGIVSAFTDSLQSIILRWNNLVGFISSVPFRVGQALGGLGRVIADSFKWAFNRGIDAINHFISRANDAIHGINLINPFSDVPRLPHIGRLHSGGIVPGPLGSERLAILQAGETVLPVGAHGMGGIHLHFHGPIGSRQELANWLTRAYDDLRRKGRL